MTFLKTGVYISHYADNDIRIWLRRNLKVFWTDDKEQIERWFKTVRVKWLVDYDP